MIRRPVQVTCIGRLRVDLELPSGGVIALDLDRKPIWERLIKMAKQSSGSRGQLVRLRAAHQRKDERGGFVLARTVSGARRA